MKMWNDEDDWFFDVLGNDVRRKIIQLLSRGPMSMKQFTDSVSVSRQAILKQLEQLQSHGLIETKEMENDEEEKRKGPPAHVYNLAQFFKIEFEVNPSFTEPRVTKVQLLAGDVKGPDGAPKANESLPDMKQCFEDMRAMDREIETLVNNHRDLYQKKVLMLNRMRLRIEESFDNDEEKEILLFLLANPRKALEGTSMDEFSSVLGLRLDFVDAVLKNLQQQGYLEKKGGLYYIAPPRKPQE